MYRRARLAKISNAWTYRWLHGHGGGGSCRSWPSSRDTYIVTSHDGLDHWSIEFNSVKTQYAVSVIEKPICSETKRFDLIRVFTHLRLRLVSFAQGAGLRCVLLKPCHQSLSGPEMHTKWLTSTHHSAHCFLFLAPLFPLCKMSNICKKL